MNKETLLSPIKLIPNFDYYAILVTQTKHMPHLVWAQILVSYWSGSWAHLVVALSEKERATCLDRSLIT